MHSISVGLGVRLAVLASLYPTDCGRIPTAIGPDSESDLAPSDSDIIRSKSNRCHADR